MEAASILSAIKGEKLKDSLQWRTWYARMKLYAKQKRVWDLCDPEIDKDERPHCQISESGSPFSALGSYG